MLSNPFMSTIRHKHGKTQFLISLDHFDLRKRPAQILFKAKLIKHGPLARMPTLMD